MTDKSEQTGKGVAQAVTKQAEQVKKSAQHLEASAGAVAKSAGELTESADRRTVLAADRTVLAAERTYAAWIRTGLVALASGIGGRTLLEQQMPRWLALSAASIMILFAMFCFGAAVWRQARRVSVPLPDTPSLPRPLLLGFSALLVAIGAASLILILSAQLRWRA
ncbi:MAG: DUF202 domain-containing protein [Vitreimonas sp.]